MLKDYHIIIVPKDKTQTRSFRVSGFTLKVILLSLALALPLVFVAVLSTIHYQNKVISIKRNNYENQRLLDNKEEMTKRIATLEKTIALMDQSIEHLGKLMDVDLEDMKYGLGPIADTDVSSLTLADDPLTVTEPGTDIDVEKWVEDNGELNTTKFNKKVNSFKEDLSLLNEKIEQIYFQNKDKIRFVGATPSLIPVNGWITSEFGMRRHPIRRSIRMHNGIDIASPVGTPIKSPSDGIVLYSGVDRGYGKMLIIDHGYGITTLYAHASELLVKRGDRIKKGDFIAKVGSSGASTGPHLHYEVQVDGIPSNPLDYIIH